jgi:hypothetical protein
LQNFCKTPFLEKPEYDNFRSFYANRTLRNASIKTSATTLASKSVLSLICRQAEGKILATNEKPVIVAQSTVKVTSAPIMTIGAIAKIAAA